MVSGEKNPYVSKALSIKGQKTNSWNLGQYKDSLRTVMCTSEINKMMDMMNLNIKRRWILTEKLFAELDALNKFLDEERKIESSKKITTKLQMVYWA